MKKILMVGTGGTIASEMTAEGLAPELNTEQLLEFIPDIGKFCRVDCLQLYNLDSTNIRPADWLGVADILRKSYDAYDGFVISHGTDTMAYTAAALSYLVQGSAKPIVLTGAQKPIWFDGTDSKRNLTDAFLYACRGCGGVQIVFNGKVILGTRLFPASTTRIWRCCRMRDCSNISARRACPGPFFMISFAKMWAC